MLSTAVKKHGIEYQSFDIEGDNLPTQVSVDLIIVAEVSEHFNDHPLATLRKFREMLSHNGAFILTTPDAAEWGRVTKYYQSLDEIPAYDGGASVWIDGHIRRYKKRELDLLLSEAGFTITSFDYAPGVLGHHLCYQLTRSIS